MTKASLQTRVDTSASFDLTKSEIEKDSIERCRRLCPREVETLKLLGYGLTQEQISGELGVTPLTVRYYVHCIHKKTQVKGRGNIILLALRAGVTSLWSRHPLETEKHGKAHR